MSELLYEAYRFRVVRESFQTDDGQTKSREIVRHPGAVVIVPMVDDEHVCLIRNFRLSVNEELIELPAGTLEPEFTALQMAHRELQEETGYTAGEMKYLHAFYLSPGILDERMHLYLATDLKAGAPAREEGEQITNLVVTFDEAIAMILRGDIKDAKTIAGLFYVREAGKKR